MPLYDYECSSCRKQFEEVKKIAERLTANCPECGGVSSLLITCCKRDWFRPHWNENIDLNPIYIESKEHYKKECEKRGLQARCLL